MYSSLFHTLQYKDESGNGFIPKKLTTAREEAVWSMWSLTSINDSTRLYLKVWKGKLLEREQRLN